jgi:hypothetical protein
MHELIEGRTSTVAAWYVTWQIGVVGDATNPAV